MCANVTGCPSDDVCPLGSRCCLQKNCSKKCVKVEILPPPPPACKCFMNKLCIRWLWNSVWLLRMSECPLWNLFLTQTSKLIFLTISGKIVYWYSFLGACASVTVGTCWVLNALIFFFSAAAMPSSQSYPVLCTAARRPTQLFHRRTKVSNRKSLLPRQWLLPQVRQTGPTWWWVLMH